MEYYFVIKNQSKNNEKYFFMNIYNKRKCITHSVCTIGLYLQ